MACRTPSLLSATRPRPGATEMGPLLGALIEGELTLATMCSLFGFCIATENPREGMTQSRPGEIVKSLMIGGVPVRLCSPQEKARKHGRNAALRRGSCPMRVVGRTSDNERGWGGMGRPGIGP